MTERLTLMLTLMPAWAAGGLLGAMFFGGLWWTMQKALLSARPALWFFSSWLLRMSLALTGFYFVAGDHWQRLLMCLLGFVMARPVVTRFTGTAKKTTSLTQEVNDAP